MSRYGYHGGWAPYIPVAERRLQAAREVEKLRRQGHAVTPVTIEGRQIAATFWGKAWCDNLEQYRDLANRVERGRSYVRNGAVLDLKIARGKVTALVSGAQIYRTTITIEALADARWQALRADCSSGIDSLVDLLQGRFSKTVMERLCRQRTGLFPMPSEIRFSCSCPDHASMCKHVAAALYGVGARLDGAPEHLFELRAVDAADLLAPIDATLPMSLRQVANGKRLDTDNLSALFGLDMAQPTTPEKVSAVKASGKAGAQSRILTTPKTTTIRTGPRRSRAVVSTAAPPKKTPR